MLTLLLTLVLLMATMATVFSQGTVEFVNTGVFTTEADRLVRDASGMPLVGTNIVAQLYYGAPTTSEGSLVPVTSPPARFRPATTSFPGTWSGGNRTLQEFDAGNEVSLQVRVWDSTAGATWEDAVAAGFNGTQYGASVVFSYIVPAGGSQTLFRMDNLRSFTLVPEPSVAIFGAIGIIAVCFWKRRMGKQTKA